jgi:hypothetical protein
MYSIHCKKRLAIIPSPAGIVFPARESLVSDIPAGEVKIANLFFPVLHGFWGPVSLFAIPHVYSVVNSIHAYSSRSKHRLGTPCLAPQPTSRPLTKYNVSDALYTFWTGYPLPSQAPTFSKMTQKALCKQFSFAKYYLF